MNITKLELVGCKRLSLNNINKFSLTPKNKTVLLLGSNGSGKAQPMDAFIKVPNGWKFMKEMKIGEQVIAKDGSITNVTGVFPQGHQEVYKVTFADGRTVEATGDHLWRIYIGGKKYPIIPKVMTTLEVIKLLQSKAYYNLLWVDLIEPEQNHDIELPVDPYVLGVIIGDGSNLGSVVITNPDIFIMEKIKGRLKDNVTVNMKNYSYSRCPCYSLSNEGNKGPKTNYIINYFREAGLFDKRSYEKHIPHLYLRASAKQRLELLQGLMDTDGTCGTSGASSYSTSSLELAENVVYLIRSLGGIAHIHRKYPAYTHNNQKLNGRVNFQINIRFKNPTNLFSLPRKKERCNDDNQYSKTLKLRILSIEPIGIKETQCISIDHPDKLYVTDNFVVTHNTTVLSNLSPLSANPSDFHKDGYKLIEITKGLDKYILRSSFGVSGNKFSFIKNNEELNSGGTATVYKELVKKEFNITQEVHELMTGVNLFHQMSVAERRNWFTKISDTDYSFALGYYQRLKEQHRDIQGAIKLSQTRLVQESAKLLTPQEEAIAREEMSFLLDSINSLLELKQPIQTPRSELNNNLDQYIKQLTILTTQFFTLLTKLNSYERFNSRDHISSELGVAYSRQQQLQLDNNSLCSKISELEKASELLKNNNVTSITSLDRDMLELVESIDELYKQLRHNFAYEDDKIALQAIYGVLEDVRSIVKDIPANPERKISREYYSSLESEQSKIKLTIATIEQHISSLLIKQKEMEHIRDHNSIECPKCQYVWHKGYSENEYKLLLTDIDTKHKTLTGWQDGLVENTKLLESAKEYLESYRLYSRVTSGYSVLTNVWEYILNSDTIFNNPSKIPTILEDVRGDLLIKIKIAELSKQCKEKQLIKDLTSKDQELNITKLEETLESLHTDLICNTRDSRYIARRIEFLNFYLDTQSKLQVLAESLESIIIKHDNTNDRLLATHKTEVINEIIQLMRMELHKREQLISKIDIQKALIVNLNNQIVELTEKAELLKLAVKELSPTEGLIAKGMSGFLNHFIGQINAFIGKIWLYPLELQPIALTEDGLDLDYKFPVKISDNLVIPDVAKGSSAQREIVDLAFRVVSAAYLGLKDGAFYADELGISFDKAHRHAVFHAISNLLTTSDFSQIFMISHYENTYGCLANSDIVVLCPANIALPKDTPFNTTVKLN